MRVAALECAVDVLVFVVSAWFFVAGCPAPVACHCFFAVAVWFEDLVVVGAAVAFGLVFAFASLDGAGLHCVSRHSETPDALECVRGFCTG